MRGVPPPKGPRGRPTSGESGRSDACDGSFRLRLTRGPLSRKLMLETRPPNHSAHPRLCPFSPFPETPVGQDFYISP